MQHVTPSAEDLSYLRADPLFWVQELDVRADVAHAFEGATGGRAGRVYWRSAHDYYLYALELADLGGGRPSMAVVYGHRPRYEPRLSGQTRGMDIRQTALPWEGERW
jgi:hypothetical protein